jgi:hypothetical protein
MVISASHDRVVTGHLREVVEAARNRNVRTHLRRGRVITLSWHGYSLWQFVYADFPAGRQ